MSRTILVCEAQVPFVRGGAEFHVRELVHQLRAHGHQVELVSVPFKWYPKTEILANAAAWRLLDLTESNGRPIDLVIATKFPTYFARHPHKVAWIIHQYRAAYELAGTPFSDFAHAADELHRQEFASLAVAVTPRIEAFRSMTQGSFADEVASMMERLGHIVALDQHCVKSRNAAGLEFACTLEQLRQERKHRRRITFG